MLTPKDRFWLGLLSDEWASVNDLTTKLGRGMKSRAGISSVLARLANRRLVEWEPRKSVSYYRLSMDGKAAIDKERDRGYRRTQGAGGVK